MLYVFLHCHLWLGQPPRRGQHVFAGANAAFPRTVPGEWAAFQCDFFKKINEMPTYSFKSNWSCHRDGNVLISRSAHLLWSQAY